MNPTFCVGDASIGIQPMNRVKAKHGWDMDWETYNRLKDELVRLGFVVGKDPRIEKDYPILSRTHNAGYQRDLEFTSEIYPNGCKFEFFQNVVYENSNGGQYDFDKLEKMPYIIRIRWQRTINALREHLINRGFTERDRRSTPNPDPLDYFNKKWDMGEMARGELRFDRGPDGWPSDKELSSWDRRDADGNQLNHGEIRYFRDYKGHLMRGRVYGGINGMWMVIYGPGLNDCAYKSAGELFSCNPSEVPRKQYPRPESVWRRQLDTAVRSQNFEKAIVMRDLIKEAA